MKTLTIDFVRHGQTLFNILNKLQGWSDSPLTPAGIAMADATGQRLTDVHYDQAYASDLKRAMDTAHHIIAVNPSLTDAPLLTSERLREVYFGSYEGSDNDQVWGGIAQPLGCRDQADIIKQHSFTAARDAMHAADPRHFAEDGATFYQRIDQALTELLTANLDDQRLLVVTHGTFIRTLTLRFGPQFHPENGYPENGSVTTLRLQAAPNDAGFTADVLAYNQH